MADGFLKVWIFTVEKKVGSNCGFKKYNIS